MSLMNAANLDPGVPGIYLLPSTQAMLEHALAVSRERFDVIVVGSLEFFRTFCPDVADGEVLTPTACFDVCEKRSSDNLTVLAFTDQLVSPEFATLLVSRAGALEFFSAFERVAVVRYEMPLFQTLNYASEAVAGGRAPIDGDRVLHEVARYLGFCAQLGDVWLAAKLQEARMPANRTAAARRRLRIYASIALSSCIAAGERAASPELLRPLFEARSALARLPG
ncbi:hypothetical protein [Luteimonas sp. RC10]|uniref:hypothetical protein n=1 Tax=Luteimonas sp. RC10 TaxID=2587035 RepID=UPI00160BB84B|nr:hypothetical protein [Luteimonas sp. RC10]